MRLRAFRSLLLRDHCRHARSLWRRRECACRRILLLLIVHGCLYVGGQPTLRSLVFAAAFAINIAIVASLIFK
jgi:uncharacterized MAPEG superfamily protein